MIPTTYEEWRSCIINDCKIDLTPVFCQQRLAVYEDRKHPETVKFVQLYGESHLNNIIYWLKKG